jgi:hypothetical protein
MPLKIDPSLYKSKDNQVFNTVLQEQILAILRGDTENAYSAQEMAAAIHARIGLPKELQAWAALLSLVFDGVAQANASVRGEFEAAVNALLSDGRIKAFIHEGTAYFSAKS